MDAKILPQNKNNYLTMIKWPNQNYLVWSLDQSFFSLQCDQHNSKILDQLCYV